eukprot:5137337-Prymnesium_polylepis.2
MDLSVPEANRTCFDCGENCAADPWASLSHGIVICLKCAGVHRSFGVHISFVRSCALDDWDAKQLDTMRALGNAAFTEFLVTQGVARRVWLALPLETRYHTPAADLYRRRVQGMSSGATDATGGLPTEIRPEVRPPAPQKVTTRQWTEDAEAPSCQLCKADFVFLFNRRHHCRKCGRCVCGDCSPPECFRPLPPQSFEPVRQCKLCVPPQAKLMVGMAGPSS